MSPELLRNFENSVQCDDSSNAVTTAVQMYLNYYYIKIYLPQNMRKNLIGRYNVVLEGHTRHKCQILNFGIDTVLVP